MTKVEIYEGDITELKVDAIVNAANSSLLGGGGVDGAIHSAAGGELLQECRSIREKEYPQGLPTGEAVITAGYQLPASHVIHTVGPVWHGGDQGEPQLLKDCYKNCLNLAVQKELNSIAFPAISTGVYHFPSQKACKIALQTVQDFIVQNRELDRIIFAVIGNNIQIYNNLSQKYFNKMEQ